MAVSDIYKAAAIFTAPLAEGEMVCTFHYQNSVDISGATNNTQAQNIAQSIVDLFNTDYIPFLADSVTFVRVDVVGISDPTAQGSWNSNTLGSLVEGNVSYRNAPIVSWKSALRGRSFNGRSFFIAPTEAQQSGGALGAGYIADLAALAADMLTLVRPNGDTYILGTYSRLLNSFAPTATLIVRPNTGTLRSRQDTQG